MGDEERIALVTGGNKGIGFEICFGLASGGVQVILTSRDEDKGLKACRQLSERGVRVEYQRLDVTLPATLDTAFEFIRSKFGKLDILINNAGIFPKSEPSALRIQKEVFMEVFETNAAGPLFISQRLIPLLKKSRNGKIINVSSGMGSLHDMGGGYPSYRISKAALNAVTRILADELKELDISVNSVCPGWVKTDMGGSNAPRSVQQGASGIVKLALMEKGIPTGKFLRDGAEIPW